MRQKKRNLVGKISRSNNNKKREKNQVKVNYFNILILISTLISGGYLLYDLIFWSLIPLFNGNFYTMTYFGFFTDIIALFMLEVCIQYLKGWFSK